MGDRATSVYLSSQDDQKLQVRSRIRLVLDGQKIPVRGSYAACTSIIAEMAGIDRDSKFSGCQAQEYCTQ